jgi:hypothetical protein
MATTVITRTALVDDDGTGTTGTIINNAWKQQLYDQIDDLLSDPLELGSSLAVTGTITATGIVTATAVRFSSTSSPAQIAANTNNWALVSTARFYRVSSDAARDVTGIVAQTDGAEIAVWNGGSFAITLKHENAGSTAANRFLLPSGGDFVLNVYQTVLLRYNGTDSRWVVLG